MEHPGDPQTETREGFFEFAADDPVYADHFPGQPVVPGSLIIHAFIGEVMAGGWGKHPVTVSQFRFMHFISPGRYRFCLNRMGGAGAGFTCELFDADTPVAAGKLLPSR